MAPYSMVVYIHKHCQASTCVVYVWIQVRLRVVPRIWHVVLFTYRTLHTHAWKTLTSMISSQQPTWALCTQAFVDWLPVAIILMMCCMVPIITGLYRHAMYHSLHVTQHLVTCCKQDQAKCASSHVHAMCDRMAAIASNVHAIPHAWYNNTEVKLGASLGLLCRG